MLPLPLPHLLPIPASFPLFIFSSAPSLNFWFNLSSIIHFISIIPSFLFSSNQTFSLPNNVLPFCSFIFFKFSILVLWSILHFFFALSILVIFYTFSYLHQFLHMERKKKYMRGVLSCYCKFLAHKCLELTGKKLRREEGGGRENNSEKREEEERKRSFSIKGKKSNS